MKNTEWSDCFVLLAIVGVQILSSSSSDRSSNRKTFFFSFDSLGLKCFIQFSCAYYGLAFYHSFAQRRFFFFVKRRATVKTTQPVSLALDIFTRPDPPAQWSTAE